MGAEPFDGRREVVRPITPKDEEALNRFFVELASRPEVTRYFHPHPFDRQTAAALASYSGKDIYVASFAGDEIAGYAMLRGWDEGYVVPSFGVAVAPAYQGQGIGSRLLRESIRIALEMGAEEVMLKVHPENPRALSWYRKVGFREFDQQADGQMILRLALDP